MKKIIIPLVLLVFGTMTAQKSKSLPTVKDKFESRQSQDFSVPTPPMTMFPAQYPKGNKIFIEEVSKNLDKAKFSSTTEKLTTQITLKVDSSGKIVNISTYGNNEIFNQSVKEAVEKTTKNVTWTAGRNNRGEKVIDIVRIPFRFQNK